jgi:hypothetical protein
MAYPSRSFMAMENAKTSTKFLTFALLFTTVLFTHSILSLVNITNGQPRVMGPVDAPASSYSMHSILVRLV